MSISQSSLNLCMSITKWFPVFFLISLLSWSYYAYVILMCFFYINNWIKRILYILMYHFFMGIFLWTYYQIIFTQAGSPNEEFYLTETEIYETATNEPSKSREIIEKRSKHLPLLTRTDSKAIRFCEKCKCIKPDRSHHCGTCQKCILKMDHHCPWVNNCVGFANYKYFILFLLYAVVYCTYVSATSFEYFMESWSELQSLQPGRFHIIFLFFVSTMFAISVFSLFAYHIYLVCENTTTLESFRAPVFHSTGLPDKNGFNLGRKENLKQVFGDSFFKAILPLQTRVLDGIRFPTSSHLANQIGSNQTLSNPLLENNNENISNSLNIIIQSS